MPLRAKHLAVPVSIMAGVGAALVTAAVAQTGGTASPQALSPYSQGTVVTLLAHLDGPDEAVGTNPTGDPTATGNVIITVNTSTGQICAAFTPSNDLGPYTAFHIHKGDSTVRNAPPLVTFPVTNPTTGPLTKCVTDTTNAPAIALNPTGYYFNVHTDALPTGAISGQLAPTSENQLLVAPVRVYDTRFPIYDSRATGGTGKFQPSQTRTVDLSTSGIPLGARAAIVTVTVTQSSGNGFLKVYSGAIPTAQAPDTSNLNFGSTQDIANNITVALDGTNKINIGTGTEPVTEHVIVDVVGYIL